MPKVADDHFGAILGHVQTGDGGRQEVGRDTHHAHRDRHRIAERNHLHLAGPLKLLRLESLDAFSADMRSSG